MPHRELFDGVAVIFGGAFLITPGFLTDVIGLLLLIPPTRGAAAPLRRRLARQAIRRQRGDGSGGRRGPAARTGAAIGPTTPSREPHVNATMGRHRGESALREPDGAFTELLRPRARPARQRALGHDAAVRGRELAGAAGRAADRAHRGWLARRAGGRVLARPEAGRRRRRTSTALLVHLCAATGVVGGREVDCLATLAETDGGAELGRARRRPLDLGAVRRRSRLPGGQPSPARRVRPRRRADRAPGCSTTASPSRSRTRASRPSTTARGASAAPASSCGWRARTIRCAGRARSSPARRCSSRRPTSMPPSSAGGSATARAPAPTS